MFTQRFWCLLLPTLCLSAAASINQRSGESLDHKTLLCEHDDAPVCARAGSEYLLFANDCQLAKAQQTKLMGDITEVSLRHCIPDCDFACGTQRQPLCGLSVSTGERRTFRNKCELVRMSCRSPAAWLIRHWNACPLAAVEPPAKQKTYVKPAKSALPVPCTAVYKPICAAYAAVKSTFENECQVNAEVLRTGKKWSIVSQGVCPEDYQTIKLANFASTTQASVAGADRLRRSYNWDSLHDVPLSADTVTIYMPPAFETEFISSGRKPAPRRLGPKPMGRAAGKPCLFSNEPVCGVFNGESRSFAHVCALIEHSRRTQDGWTILHEGLCRTCDFKCDASYAPICVNRNGIHYTMLNRCYLKRVQCRDRSSSWRIVSEGECSSPLQDMIEDKFDTTTAAQRSTTKYPAKATPNLFDAKRQIAATGAARTTSEHAAVQLPAVATSAVTSTPTAATAKPYAVLPPHPSSVNPVGTWTLSLSQQINDMTTTELPHATAAVGTASSEASQLTPRTAATTIATTTKTTTTTKATKLKKPKIYKSTARKPATKINRKSSINANSKSIARQFLWVQPNANVNKKVSTKFTTTSGTSTAKPNAPTAATLTGSTTTKTTIQRQAETTSVAKTSRPARKTTTTTTTITEPTTTTSTTTKSTATMPAMTIARTTKATTKQPSTTTATKETEAETETAIHFIITPFRKYPTTTTTSTTRTRTKAKFENDESQMKVSKKWSNAHMRQPMHDQNRNHMTPTTTTTTTTRIITTTTPTLTLSRPMQVKKVADTILRPAHLVEMPRREKKQKTTLMGIRIPTDAIPKLLPPSMIKAATPPYSYWIKKVTKTPMSLRSKILKMRQSANERTSIYGHGKNSIIMRMVRKSLDNNQLE